MNITVGDNCVELIDNVSMPQIVRDTCEALHVAGQSEDAFFVCDLGDVARKYELWLQKLPRVEPFYAMKCNPNSMIVNLLASLGVGFDCASKEELGRALRAGVRPESIIYANPCKQISHIKYAESCGIRLVTFDSAAEVKKISIHHPNALLVLRIFVGANKARCPLGLKFGAQISEVPSLLTLAMELGLNVIGVSFHVGSGCFEASVYRTAIETAHQVFLISQSLGNPMSLLDIGGGFPGMLEDPHEAALFEDACSTINDSLDQYFPLCTGVRVIAEPGRYFVASAFQLSCTVTSIRTSTNQIQGTSIEQFGYFLNDGVYGSFNCLFFDHHVCDFYLLSGNGDSDEEVYPSIFWGPTCDSIDKIMENFSVRKLEIGDRVVFKNMGAYTMAAASTFNGFQTPLIKYVASKSDWCLLCPFLEDKTPTSEAESDSSAYMMSSAEPQVVPNMFVEALSEII